MPMIYRDFGRLAFGIRRSTERSGEDDNTDRRRGGSRGLPTLGNLRQRRVADRG
jgi:hypothetical protein